VNPRLLDLLREQQASGFPDVAGAEASATIPLSDRLVTRLALEGKPPTAPISELDLRALEGNRFTARVRLSKPAWVPPMTLTLHIERQPRFPEDPVLILRLAGPGGLLSLASGAMKFLNVLPPGVRMDGDLVFVNLATLAANNGGGEFLQFVKGLEVTTEAGRFVIRASGAVPPRQA
jgi:hypothetical protein